MLPEGRKVCANLHLTRSIRIWQARNVFGWIFGWPGSPYEILLAQRTPLVFQEELPTWNVCLLFLVLSDFFLRIKSRELWVDWVGDNVFPLLILLYWPSWIGLLLFILGIQFNHNLNKPWWLILLQKLSQQRKHFWSVLLFCQSKHSDFACCEMFAPPVFSLYKDGENLISPKILVLKGRSEDSGQKQSP